METNKSESKREARQREGGKRERESESKRERERETELQSMKAPLVLLNVKFQIISSQGPFFALKNYAMRSNLQQKVAEAGKAEQSLWTIGVAFQCTVEVKIERKPLRWNHRDQIKKEKG